MAVAFLVAASNFRVCVKLLTLLWYEPWFKIGLKFVFKIGGTSKVAESNEIRERSDFTNFKIYSKYFIKI